MKHLLDEEEKEEFVKAMANYYEAFKENCQRYDQGSDEEKWKQGVESVFDALVQSSKRLTYDASTLRSDLECLFDELDNGNQKRGGDYTDCQQCHSQITWEEYGKQAGLCWDCVKQIQ